VCLVFFLRLGVWETFESIFRVFPAISPSGVPPTLSGQNLSGLGKNQLGDGATAKLRGKHKKLIQKFPQHREAKRKPDTLFILK
jgi:hypothetical protein